MTKALIEAVKTILQIKRQIFRVFVLMYLKMNGVDVGRNLQVASLPYCRKHPNAVIKFGSGVRINNRLQENPAGISNRSVIVCAAPGASIYIGDHSGMSGAVLHSIVEIRIGAFVNIGAGTCVYDHDFHPLPYMDRRNESKVKITGKPVAIGDDVFIGAKSIILKGVTIGARSIIGAGSVVVSDIPPDCIAAGNPAKVLRSIKSV